MNQKKRAAVMGVDIGTTNISIAVMDLENNELLCSRVVPDLFRLPTQEDLSEHDVAPMMEQVVGCVDALLDEYPLVKSIGVTGQMHGVVLLDRNGAAVSPLYNWQDARANREFSAGNTYCQEIFKRTGHCVASGYGLATLFYNRVNGLIPTDARTFCTVMDYAVMLLAGLEAPLIHPTNAASLGLFDLTGKQFDAQAIKALQLDGLALPQISQDCVAGYRRGIPVSVAIGDNQASFFGSVREEQKAVLVNFGTGSQLSVVTESLENIAPGVETRPYLFGKYLLCCSALCGGKAYALLERFFNIYAAQSSGSAEPQYELMNRLASEAYQNGRSLKVCTKFCGTRQDPAQRGWINGIDDENFTPGNLILGVLQGMIDELTEGYDRMAVPKARQLVVSGNAVKKNRVLQMLLSDTFGLPVALTQNDEEAAIGAALYAGVCSGVLSADRAEKMIQYREE